MEHDFLAISLHYTTEMACNKSCALIQVDTYTGLA